MDILLISFISLLSVCLAVFAMEKKVVNGANTRWSLISTAGSSRVMRAGLTLASVLAGIAFYAAPTFAQSREGGEANLKLPDLSDVTFFGGIDGHRLLLGGIVICVLGLGFGMAMYMNLKKLPVHRAMREISELIYETCKTYLITQGKFILILEAFIAVVIILYSSVWLALPVVTAWPGLVFASIPSLTRALHTPVSRASRFRFMQFR